MFVDLLAFVPGGIGIELQPERRGQHCRGKVLGLVTGGLGGHAVVVLFRDIAIHVGVRRLGQAEAGVDMAAEFIGLRSGHDAEGDVAGLEQIDRCLAVMTSQRGGRIDDT